MNILITGASGYLGSALARHLEASGHELALLLRPSSSLKRLDRGCHRWRMTRCDSDAEIADFIAAVCPEAVIHTACSYGRSGEKPLQLLDVNLRYGAAVLQGLTDLPRRKAMPPVCFINTGTCLPPELSPYASSKHQFALWGHASAARSDSGLKFVNLRLQHMYGPHEDRSRFVAHVMHACHEDQPVLALTAGEQERDFIHLDDVLTAVDTILAQAQALTANEDFDLGSGQATTIRSLVEAVHRMTASRTRLDFGALPYRVQEAMHCCADITRLRALGWRPTYDLTTGLRRTLDMEFPS